MRLLNTKTFRVQGFYANIPPYAVLSHTWDKEEVIFQDIQNLDIAKEKFGWSKVEGACAYARRHEFEWIWIDSCCINKESSAELSEAINSMYQYYSEAEICYVYLPDVQREESPPDPKSAFGRSRWFTRGWTLQELIAPAYVLFFDTDWMEIGTKWSLRDTISAIITTIPRNVFENGDIDKYSVAQKMSWAAWRQTTRPEDQAYCLLGIFDISMSPIYGEGGAKAFMRLQQEIIKTSDDRSIFAWISDPEFLGLSLSPRGLFARSPYEFRASGDVRMLESDILGTKSSFSFNNNGLRIHIPLIPADLDGRPGFKAPLHCQSENDDKYLSIYLELSNGGRYVRYHSSRVLLDSTPPTESNLQEVVVKEVQHSRGLSLRSLRPLASQVILSQTAQTLTYLEDRKEPEGFWAFFAKNVHNYVYSTPEADMFSVAMANNHFTVITDTTVPNIEGTLKSFPATVLKPLFSQFKQQGHRPDRIQTCLKSGGMISIALCICGQNRKLEIDYLPPGDYRIQALTKPEVDTPKLGLLFDDMSLGIPTVNVYPSDYYHMVLYRKPSEKFVPETFVYTSISQDYPFRIFSFAMEWLKSYVFIAAGIHNSKLWTDVVLFDEGEEPPQVEEIWNSYLDGGPRASARLGRPRSWSSGTFQQDGIEYSLDVRADERRKLQIGTHSVQALLTSIKKLEDDFMSQFFAASLVNRPL
ncbi:hypothetical protein VKT23_020523 [Stygiomarasmius scandens]|uniref:Heterokaryon incompatibility domain-containing protein n=1 Tax=Marasmiellus scandens TaxID=2682957 RepID=A0ABR1IIW6_9AGAR